MKLSSAFQRAQRPTALIPLALVLFACSSPQPLAAGNPSLLPTVVEPTLRSVEVVAGEVEALPTQPAPTLPPPPPTTVPQLASSAFRDDFNGALDPGWSWSQNDTPGSSLTHTPGWLRLNLSQGSFLVGPAPENLLLRPAPGGDFAMSTWLRFNPHNNFELAGLVVVFDDGSVLQFGRGGCFFEAPTPGCIGDGLYFDHIQNGAAVGSNFATQSLLGLDYALRLERQTNAYTALFSTDGSNWTPLGSHTAEQAPASIGLIAAQATVANPYADFDYFELTQE